jgi:spore maturation protein CgeB
MDLESHGASLKIIYIGHSHSGSTSRHRADALGRLGHEVRLRDPYTELKARLSGRIRTLVHYRTGYRLLQAAVTDWAASLLSSPDLNSPDLIWVDSGELLGPGPVSALRRFGCPIVLYSIDDATGKRDGRRFDSLVNALPLYDLCVVMRDITAAEFLQKGARKVLKVWMSYDEVAHRPFDDIAAIPPQFRSDVAFVGTWMRGEKRDQFLSALIARGIQVAIWGDRWDKAPTWESLKPYWRGRSLSGRDYVAAIQGAKVAIGMLSKGNRDQHTTRSVEIPYARGLLCAERTTEHLGLYEEGVEAVFWGDVEECASACQALLDDPARRDAICLAGSAKVRNSALGNEDICARILNSLSF